MEEETKLTKEVKGGAFEESLYRNNKQIRKDRAQAIVERAKLIYRREIEDLEVEILEKGRDQSNMLDFSPTDVLATSFDAKKFVIADIALAVSVKNLEIKLEIAKKRFEYLFGGE